jgi:putative ABC transport system permease protein
MSSIPALWLLAWRRALANPQLLAIRFIGVLIAVSLVAAVSLYSGAMGDAMLQQRIGTDPTNLKLSVSLSSEPLTGAKYAALDTYIRHGLQADVTLPLSNLHIHHTTTTVPVYPLGSQGMRLLGPPVASLALDYYEGWQDQVSVYAGSFNPPVQLPDGDVPVLISAYTARSLHLSVGERLAFGLNTSQIVTPAIIISGIYVPNDSKSSFWDIHAGDPTYRSFLAPSLASFQIFASFGNVFSPAYFWLQQAQLTDIHLAGAHAIVNGIGRANSKIAALATGATLITSLDVTINGFFDQYDQLPSILLILVAPIIAVILYGIAVITALVLDRQATEIVLMRSRGATSGQAFALYVGEGLALGALALLIGPLLGLPLASLIGQSSGFLEFGGGLHFAIHLLPATYLYGGITALLCLLASLLPAMGLTRQSMTAFKGEQARQRRQPFWQRFYLDLLALAVSLYGLNLLIRQGTVSSGDPTAIVSQDPLIAVAPLLFAIAITLLLSRILPWLALLGLHLLGVLSSPSAFVALQRVGRAPRQPMRLVQLCTLTLTMGIFAATVAGVQASNLRDQYLYQAGAPLRLFESYNRAQVPPALRNEPDIMPLADHLALPGVHAATPALRYESAGNVINTTDNGTAVNVLGVDPASAASVMWYRPDFADESFSQLLQTIGTRTPNALVSGALLAATGLHRGDTFTVTLTNNVGVSFRIAGVIQYFPSLDPTQYPFIVCNLAYLEQASKSHGPNEVWLNTDQNQATINNILIAVSQWPRDILSYEGLPPADAAQGNPLSAGIYGVVSVGFLIAVAFVLLGFIAYAYLTLHQRLAEVAILRALGLSQGQVRSLLLFEEVFLLGVAILGGITAGLLTTRLFLPYLPIAASVVPPFVVVMPWVAVGEFVLAVLVVFLLVLSVHVSLLLRVQLGQVLRLGDA